MSKFKRFPKWYLFTNGESGAGMGKLASVKRGSGR